MSQVMLRRAAAILIAAVAILHIYVALVLEFGEYFEEHLIIGLMFLVGSAAGLVAAFLLLGGPYKAGWTLGALVAGGMLAGLIISRTVGLLGFNEQGAWNEPAVILSIMLEVMYLGTWAVSVVAPQEALVEPQLLEAQAVKV